MLVPRYLNRKLLHSQRHKLIWCAECKQRGWMGGTDTKRRRPVCKRCVAEAVELDAMLRGLFR